MCGRYSGFLATLSSVRSWLRCLAKSHPSLLFTAGVPLENAGGVMSYWRSGAAPEMLGNAVLVCAGCARWGNIHSKVHMKC
mmetsp:Transcript_37289/g.105858  ORF Transcript_37289/g.105858 Transcript_37289/m.105858 type:complete len:81 (-) Transcript_37289:75-317(-)